jgi:anaerobic selenocysteine-containing dehydrogenase
MYGPLRFFNTLGTTTTIGGICNEGGIEGLNEIFGTYSITNPLQIIAPETKLIVNWSANISENNNHTSYLIKEKIRKGTHLIVIDTRKIPVADHSDLFLQPNPNSDHLLSKIILLKLIQKNAIDINFLKKNVEGYENVLKEISFTNISENLPLIGIEEHNIDKFVDELIRFKHHTIFNIGYGLQKHKFGGRMVQIVSLIQIVLGNICKSGTGIIYSQSGFNKPIINPLISFITQNFKSSKSKEIELIALGSQLLKEKYKILFIYNCNPASSLPNQNQLRKALIREDLFVVVLDLFLNESTKYAEVVIPAKFDLEASDFISSYYIPGISIIEGGPCPYDECRSNYEFFRDLAFNLNINNKEIFKADHPQLFEKCFELLPKEIRRILKQKGFYLLHKRDSIPFNK